jgi:hypothetical protein
VCVGRIVCPSRVAWLALTESKRVGSVIVGTDGRVWTFGSNRWMQVTVGAATLDSTPRLSPCVPPTHVHMRMRTRADVACEVPARTRGGAKCRAAAAGICLVGQGRVAPGGTAASDCASEARAPGRGGRVRRRCAGQWQWGWLWAGGCWWGRRRAPLGGSGGDLCAGLARRMRVEMWRSGGVTRKWRSP